MISYYQRNNRLANAGRLLKNQRLRMNFSKRIIMLALLAFAAMFPCNFAYADESGLFSQAELVQIVEKINSGAITQDQIFQMLAAGEITQAQVDQVKAYMEAQEPSQPSQPSQPQQPPVQSRWQKITPTLEIQTVAMQVGGYLTQLQTYDQAFQNMDATMMNRQKERKSESANNRYALLDAGENAVFQPEVKFEDARELWARPYVGFENDKLSGGPKVSNVSYGTFFGGDTEMFEFGNGWKGNVGLYGAYNGSYLDYDGVGIYMNGGTFGTVGTVYKNNFFGGVTVNAGAQSGMASSVLGDYNTVIITSGVAAKAGYNFELKDGDIILQPSMMMSYSYVDTFDYKTSYGYKVTTNPLHAMQLEPGIKLIWNTKSGWQPYANVSFAWTLLDKVHSEIAGYSLPEMSLSPYVKYGVGVHKKWNNRFSLSEQTYVYNGGRNGVGLNMDCRWAVGRDRL